MAAVVVAGRRPLYEMGAADLVVKQLSELSLVGLKQLFRMEDLVDPKVGTMHPKLALNLAEVLQSIGRRPSVCVHAPSLSEHMCQQAFAILVIVAKPFWLCDLTPICQA